MVAAVAMFAVMDTTMKMLAEHYPAMQVTVLRCLSSMPLVCAFMAWRGKFGGIFRVHWPLHLLRGVLGVGMLTMFAYALKSLPLAETYSIFFIAPALITALSVFILKEKVDATQWGAIVVGLIGVLVVLRPEGTSFISVAGLAVLASAACYAVSAIASRILAKKDSGEHIMFWVLALTAGGALPLAWPNWVPIQMDHWPVLLALAVSGFFGQLALTKAFSMGKASIVAPFEYTALAWGVAIDWALWNTLPDFYTLLGAGIIIGSGIYLVRREAVHAEAEHP
ncbi:DMT family transporter [Massilia endophytica]|uniref:DMT family transporter n=1 Tax=Massilia endophytica TaxID=2899220 RepID=UPI001E344D30|nr:DMT family transporter [Massilia endophytica]UGQ49168.1 DMT family transporter [Massilia endophytica]